MKKLICYLIITILLTSCAARDEKGNIIYNEDGSEKISGWRTTGAIVGTLAAIAGALAIANQIDKHGNGSGGNSDNDYNGTCECPNDKDVHGYYCGNRSAYIRFNGHQPSRNYCLNKEYRNPWSNRYTY